MEKRKTNIGSIKITVGNTGEKVKMTPPEVDLDQEPRLKVVPRRVFYPECSPEMLKKIDSIKK
jgi:hypothetical protein